MTLINPEQQEGSYIVRLARINTVSMWFGIINDFKMLEKDEPSLSKQIKSYNTTT